METACCIFSETIVQFARNGGKFHAAAGMETMPYTKCKILILELNIN